MDPDREESIGTRGTRGDIPPGFRSLLKGILQQASRSYSQSELLCHVCEALVPFSRADYVSFRIEEGGKTTRCRATRTASEDIRVDVATIHGGLLDSNASDQEPDAIPEPILQAILSGSFAAPVQSFTRGRSFWTGDSTRPIRLQDPDDAQQSGRTVIIGGEYSSLALILVPIHGRSRGVMFLASRRQGQFSRDDVQLYEMVAAAIGVALAHQGTQWALGERVKELTCLYSIERLASRAEIHLERILAEIVKLLPPGWQYPGRTVARIQLDEHCFVSYGFSETPYRQSAPIVVGDRPRGVVEVFYLGQEPDADEGPFLKEERTLINAVAETIARLASQHETQWALGERAKELTCLYGIERLASRAGIHLEEILPEIVKLLPPGWQYPEITVARIQLDEHRFVSDGFRETPFRQSAEIVVDDRPRGMVEVYYLEQKPHVGEGPFLKEERNLINAVAETISRLASQHETQWALRERVKELTCLYGISTIASRPDIAPEDFFKESVEVLPPGWQYPEITEAQITLDDQHYATAQYADSPVRQRADIVVDEIVRGSVEVVYTEERPPAFEGPFLKEERHLINEIARQLSFIVERWEAEQESKRLQEQLRHAERLATVGQLSAGIAHELNEPLGAILGFAELANDFKDMPVRVGRDIGKIIDSALHAREIIHKLMIFTRQMPTRKELCDLNLLVKGGLYFLESRCVKEGITLDRRLEQSLPRIMADASQMHQVLVNLVVNAIQAMPDGGTLTITTHSEDKAVYLTVEDTGAGMSLEVQKHLFVPFFTTKDVGQGTGLGLAVVQGIVASHGGTITVHSQEGQGSSFEVRLPRENPAVSDTEA
jgi:signal transduction histidine kinase